MSIHDKNQFKRRYKSLTLQVFFATQYNIEYLIVIILTNA